jgi:hypothetical protein
MTGFMVGAAIPIFLTCARLIALERHDVIYLRGEQSADSPQEVRLRPTLATDGRPADE